MEPFQIIFYTKEDGTQPAREFMDGLSEKMRTRFAKLIVLLREEGVKLRMPYSEYLKDGIFQIRAQQEGNIARVLYFFWDGQKIILTNGFTKKTQKRRPLKSNAQSDIKRTMNVGRPTENETPCNIR